MHNLISSDEFEDIIGNLSLSNNVRNKRTLELDKKYGDIKISSFRTGNGITYSSFFASFHEDTIIEGEDSRNTSFVSFNVSDSFDIKSIDNRSKYHFNSNSCLFGRRLKKHKTSHLYRKKKQYKCHIVELSPELYNEIILYNRDCNLYSDDMAIDHVKTITYRQKILLNEILATSSLAETIQQIYIESKILDLVCASVDEAGKDSNESKIHLSTQDIESLKKAKKVLLENSLNPPSIKELARKSATNEFKLKKGFKQLFGYTVYGLLQEHRLNQAKLLLERDDISVSEAASLVGYKSIGHFSKIFKDRFGVLARDVIKSRKYYRVL